MSKKATNGVVRVGHITTPSDDSSDAVSVQFDSKGAIITRPRRANALEAFHRMTEGHEIARVLHYCDHQGYLTFAECRVVGSNVSSNGATVERIRSTRVVVSDHKQLPYDEIDGMSTEIDGLATWARMTTVTQSIVINQKGSGISAVNVRAENPEPLRLGGRLNLSLETAFRHKSQPEGNVYSITDILTARSQTDTLVPWREHGTVHHMLQDLMCLTYGKPCLMRLKSARRQGNHDADDGPMWNEVYEPTFGRQEDHVKALDRAKDVPLFCLDDIDQTALESWIDGFDRWARSTWIAVTTMFQRGTTVEARLLQIGVALEALGYAILLDAGETPPRNPKFAELLERITDALGFEHTRIYGNMDASSWRQKFNSAFKGSKHADNPLPDPLEARKRADQGLTLIRCWLAVRLGVSVATLEKSLDRR